MLELSTQAASSFLGADGTLTTCVALAFVRHAITARIGHHHAGDALGTALG